jgi:hypothetical protein
VGTQRLFWQIPGWVIQDGICCVQTFPTGHGGIVGQMVIVHDFPLGAQLTGVAVGFTAQQRGTAAHAVLPSIPFMIVMGQPPGGVALQIYPAGQSVSLVQR